MIQIKNLSRSFGSLIAVNDINFTINPGEIVGFLGPNGAGKTTTLRMMVGYLQPNSGAIEIDGKSIYTNPLDTSRRIGYLPESNPLYEDMLVYDYLEYVSELRGLTGADFQKRLHMVVEKCGLKTVLAQLIGTLSKGYRQRVGLAQAIIHDPELLILDEPTSGLDPNQILEIRELIRELGTEKTVILSSHIMQEVQALCDRVIIINKGKIVANDTKENLSFQLGDRSRLVVELESPNPDFTQLLTQCPSIQQISSIVDNGTTTVEFEASNNFDLKREVAIFMSKHGMIVSGMYVKKHSLEEIFYSLTMSETDTQDAQIEDEPLSIASADDLPQNDNNEETGRDQQ